LKVVHLQSILDKIRSRLAGWQGRLLNPAGRRELVRSVLSVIPVYLLTSIKAPKQLFEDLDKARRVVEGSCGLGMLRFQEENAKLGGHW